MDLDNHTENLEQAFIALSFNKGQSTMANDSQAAKMLKAIERAQMAGDEDEEYGVEDGEDVHSKALEELADANHTNYKKISYWYKLFDVVTSANPSQVLRYSPQ